MRKFTTLLSGLTLTALGWQANAQVYVNENFDAGMPATWTIVDNGGATGDSWFAGMRGGTQNLDGTDGALADSDDFGNGTILDEELITPVFNSTTATNLFLEFDQYYNNIGADSAIVQVFDGTSWVTVLAQHADIGAFSAPDQQSINISAYANANMQVRFVYHDANTWAWYWMVDNVVIHNISCPAPTALMASSPSSTTASLSWTEAGSATAWQIESGVAGFTPGTGTIAPTTTNPHILTGLTASTDYDFYVRAVCGTGDSSLWVGPYSFSTPCAALTLPFNEDFENAGAIPNCWTMAGGENWLFNLTGPNHVGTGGTINGNSVSDNYYATVDASGSDAPATLTSPLVDVSTLLNPKLTFYEISDNEGNANSVLDVEIWDGAAWNMVASYDSNTVALSWEKKEIVLDALTFTGPAAVRFTFSETVPGDFYDDIAIDDVTFEEGPCPTPTLGVATSITTTSADLGWTGNGTTWDIEYDTTGFTPTGTPTVVGTTTNPHSLTGLTDNTSYDFYVRTDCGGGDLSGWAGPFSFMTNIVGVNENASNNGVSIFPNPNNGIFTLEVNADDASVKVMNTQGQIILTKNILTNNAKIDLSNNAKGIYFVTVTSENGVSTQKVIVQ
jgi:hypothetical protein